MTMVDRSVMAALSLFFTLLPAATAIPVQITINQRATECLFEHLNDGEHVTTSLVILSGSELKATTEFDGPIPSETPIESGAQLYEAVKRLEVGMFGSHHAVMHETETVDFEHLNLGQPPDEEDDEDEEIPENETIEQRRDRRARQRKKALEARQRRDMQKVEQKEHVLNEGDPVERTRKAQGTGWYRFCVKSASSWGQIVVEVDFRKESEMGGVDEADGHVFTAFDKAYREEEDYLMADTAETEGIKDEDFELTREKLKNLRRLIADIQSKQAQERHRLVVHSTTNQHSHSRMVLSSLLETILFMAVTGYQVYTIRKWFRGAPVLGR